MALINLRNALMTGTRTPTAKDYVQNGLAYLYDGIENAGWGRHSASQNGWVNLVDGTMPFVFTQSADTYFGNNFLHRNTSSGNLMPSFEVVKANSTTEIVLNVSTDNNPSNNARFLGTYSLVNGYRFEVDCYSTTPASAPRMYWLRSGTTTQKITYLNFGRTSPWGLWSLCLMIDNDGIISVRDSATGASASTGTTAVDFGFYGNEPINIGCWGNSQGQMICDIYRIARYNRVLTADEIARNYAIDKARFDLP